MSLITLCHVKIKIKNVYFIYKCFPFLQFNFQLHKFTFFINLETICFVVKGHLSSVRLFKNVFQFSASYLAKIHFIFLLLYNE